MIGAIVSVLGTKAMDKVVLKSKEAGQRWALRFPVGLVPEEAVGSVYERCFPQLATHAAVHGKEGLGVVRA